MIAFLLFHHMDFGHYCELQTADSVLKALDPNEIVTYTLFRDSTKYEDGIYVKVKEEIFS